MMPSFLECGISEPAPVLAIDVGGKLLALQRILGSLREVAGRSSYGLWRAPLGRRSESGPMEGWTPAQPGTILSQGTSALNLHPRQRVNTIPRISIDRILRIPIDEKDPAFCTNTHLSPQTRPSPYPTRTATMAQPATPQRWLQRKLYQFELSLSVYMMTPGEKFAFCTLYPPSPKRLTGALANNWIPKQTASSSSSAA